MDYLLEFDLDYTICGILHGLTQHAIGRVDGGMILDDLKHHVRTIGKKYTDREQRARRLFIEERAASLQQERDREFAIRTEISTFFASLIRLSAFADRGKLALAFIRTNFSSRVSPI